MKLDLLWFKTRKRDKGFSVCIFQFYGSQCYEINCISLLVLGMRLVLYQPASISEKNLVLLMYEK